MSRAHWGKILDAGCHVRHRIIQGSLDDDDGAMVNVSLFREIRILQRPIFRPVAAGNRFVMIRPPRSGRRQPKSTFLCRHWLQVLSTIQSHSIVARLSSAVGGTPELGITREHPAPFFLFHLKKLYRDVLRGWGREGQPVTLKNTLLDLDTLGDAVGAAVEQVLGGEPIILTRDGRPAAALVSFESLRTLQRERELLRRLALGELESAAGEGEELESVLDDCRMLLEES